MRMSIRLPRPADRPRRHAQGPAAAARGGKAIRADPAPGCHAACDVDKHGSKGWFCCDEHGGGPGWLGERCSLAPDSCSRIAAAPLFRARVRPSAPLPSCPVDDILKVLADEEGRLTSEIAEAISLTASATRTRLARLAERGWPPSTSPLRCTQKPLKLLLQADIVGKRWPLKS